MIIYAFTGPYVYQAADTLISWMTKFALTDIAIQSL